jgi:hypothetical protein
MNTKFKINSNNMEYYYPYMGMFTNNPNDIRSLQFLNYYSNNKQEEYIKVINNKKYLKYEYHKLFEDARTHHQNLEYYLNIDHFDNYYFRKWYFDFIYSGRKDNDDFFKFPTLYPEKAIYQYVFPRKEIINNLRDQNAIDQDTINAFNNGFDITDMDGQFFQEDIKILDELIKIYKERLNTFIYDLDGYIDENGNENGNGSPGHPIPIIPTPSPQFKTTFIGKFDKDKSKLIININELLDNKYLHFAMLKEDEEHGENIDDYDDDKYDACMGTHLNIDKDKCNIMLLNVLFKEKGYGKESKEFFRNDNNFKIFDNNHMKNIQHISLNYKFILDKLNFKIKEREFYINDNIYDYFLEGGDCKSINKVYKYTVEVESKEPVFEEFNENDKLMVYNSDEKNIPSKITKIINKFKVQITLNKTVINNPSISNYEDKDEDYKVNEDDKEKIEKINKDILYIGTRDIIIQKGNIYLKYYESVESWKKHQTVDRVLNNNKNLLEYLNLYITTINKKIIFLNPIFKNINKRIMDNGFIFVNIFNKIPLNKNNLYLIPHNITSKKKTIPPNFKIICNSILNLFLDKDVDNDDIIKTVRGNISIKSKDIKQLIEYNFLNKVQLLNNYFNNPNKRNTNILLSILNLSNSFNKNIEKYVY